MASSHSSIQQTAPGTKHHPVSPQRRSVLRRGALQSFTRHPHNTMGDRVLSHPPHLGAHQSISPLAQPQGSLTPSAPTHSVLARSAPLALLCQLYLQLISPPPGVSLHPHRFLGLSSSFLLSPLASPSRGPTCCPSPRSGALPSSGMAQPVSGVPGGKVITDPVPFQRLPPPGRT